MHQLSVNEDRFDDAAAFGAGPRRAGQHDREDSTVMAQRGTVVVCEYGHRVTLDGPGELSPCREIVTDSDGVRSPCGSQVWRTVDLWPFPVTTNDRRFLRSLRITPDA